MNCTRWDARFLGFTDFIASRSEDDSRKVGVVIVGEANDVRATGFNGLPRDISSETKQRHSSADRMKYLWHEHAERNAIYSLARSGQSGADCRMYTNCFPCADCARAIVQTGITSLRTFNFDPDDQNYREHYNVAAEMLKEAGVSIHLYDRQDAEILKLFQVLDNVRKGDFGWFR